MPTAALRPIKPSHIGVRVSGLPGWGRETVSGAIASYLGIALRAIPGCTCKCQEVSGSATLATPILEGWIHSGIHELALDNETAVSRALEMQTLCLFSMR